MFIELTKPINKYSNPPIEQKVKKFLMHFQSGWCIYDNGSDVSAHWCNDTLGMNYDVTETYQQIKDKLITAGLLICK